MQLSQSTILVGALLAAFVVWLAMNGRLNAYWSLLTGSAAGAQGSASAGSTGVPGSQGLGSTSLPGLTSPSLFAPGGVGGSPTGPSGVAAPGGSGGPLQITVTPNPLNVQGLY